MRVVIRLLLLYLLKVVLIINGSVAGNSEYHFCVDGGQKILLREHICEAYNIAYFYSIDDHEQYSLKFPHVLKGDYVDCEKGLDFSCSCERPSGACVDCYPHKDECLFKGIDGFGVDVYLDKQVNEKGNLKKESLAESNVLVLFQLLRSLTQHFGGNAPGSPPVRASKQVISDTMKKLSEVSERSYSVFIPSAVVVNPVKSALGFIPVTGISDPQVISGQYGIEKAIAFNVNFQGFSKDSAAAERLPGIAGEYRIDLANGSTSTTLNFSNSRQRKIFGDLSEHKNTQECRSSLAVSEACKMQ